MDREDIDKILGEALIIEAEAAKKAGAVGYMARAMVQATLPHKATPGSEFHRENGLFSLTILAPSKIGLPYGSIPRLLLSWMTTEALYTRSPVLELGPTLSAFLAELGLGAAQAENGGHHKAKKADHPPVFIVYFLPLSGRHNGARRGLQYRRRIQFMVELRKRRIKPRFGNPQSRSELSFLKRL